MLVNALVVCAEHNVLVLLETTIIISRSLAEVLGAVQAHTQEEFRLRSIIEKKTDFLELKFNHRSG